ncbi:MAG: ribokinase [Chloroflexi bacterium]|nr:ribokinase [Chloroflexota bacterium]
MTAPDFVVVGHAVRDIVPGGWRLGGTVTFAAVQAHRLGMRVGVVTRAGGDLDVAAELPFAEVVQAASPSTTSFENLYHEGHRHQYIRAHAGRIERGDVPDAWRSAPIVLLGPVFGELEPGFGTVFDSASLVGVSAQGWLRSQDVEGHVHHTRWEGPPFWTGADVLFVSDEDLAGGRDEMAAWTAGVGIVAMTESWKGARVFANGAWRRMDAFPETEVDPTGAGDTFATGFLIRLRETGSVDEAARFGAAAASLSVGGIATNAMPTRVEVEARLRQYPEIALT